MSRKFTTSLAAIALVLVVTVFIKAYSNPSVVVTVAGENLKIEFNQLLHSRIIASYDETDVVLGDFVASEYVSVNGKAIADFSYTQSEVESIQDDIGTGRRHLISGESSALRKTLSITQYDEYPSLAIYEVTYTNTGESEVVVDRWTNNSYRLSANRGGKDHPFWSYQSGSFSSRPDWVLPLSMGFSQQNYMGMNASDYGGGTPVSNVWRGDYGIGVGHLELVPKLVSLPVNMPNARHATLGGVEYEKEFPLAQGESMTTFTTFVNVHKGDYFQTLSQYRALMIDRGIEFPDVDADAYETQWCAWGYERDFTMNQVYGTLPMVRELGYHWVVLDDGWQTNVGDWELHPEKYPRGDADMQAFVNRVHDEGFRSKLWWAPLAMHPESNIYKTNPEFLLLDEAGEPVHISWWQSHYMCPAYGPVQQYTNRQVRTFMDTWGYQGLKIDGQHLNAAPPCYNPAHGHDYPEESVEKVPQFFAGIHETAKNIVADALIEICPCGTAYSFHNMPFMTQGVASDPTSSWQVRHKGKTLKALMGPSTPYFGDHVELSSGGEDFASSVGIGAVIGTKFTWPIGAKENSEAEMTAEREEKWGKWAEIYNSQRLAQGIYRGDLYDIGFDRPETHAIEKDGSLYFAFYADQRPGRDHDDQVRYAGRVELRGLADGLYTVRDYENNRDLGSVEGPVAALEVDFVGHLLLEATPRPATELTEF